MRDSRWSRCWVLALSLASGLLSGCTDEPALGLVRGRVRLDGQPLPNATVMFVPVQGGRPGMAVTDSDGEYELRFNGTRKGAIFGRHQVKISTFSPEQQVMDETGNNVVVTPEQSERLPRRYHARTELSAVVEPGRSTFDFDLQSDPNEPLSAIDASGG